MALDFWNNPIVVSSLRVKYRRGGLRRNLSLYIFALGAVILGIFYIKQSGAFNPPAPPPRPAPGMMPQLQPPAPGQFHLILFLVLLGWQFLFSGGLAIRATMASIRREVESGTLDFQRIAALSPYQILLGKLLGESSMAFLLAAASFPFAFLFMVLGATGLTPDVLLLSYLTLMTSTLLAGAFGLIHRLEASEGRSTTTVGGVVRIFVGIFILNVAVQGMVLLPMLLQHPVSAALAGLPLPVALFAGLVQYHDAWHYSLSFFGFHVPFLIATPIAQLAISWFLLHWMARRLTRPLDPALSKPTAYVTLAVVDLLSAGALHDVNPIGASAATTAVIFWLIHLAATITLLLSVTPGKHALLSWVWRLRGRRPRLLDLWLGDRSENILVLITFCTIGLAIYFGLVIWPGQGAAVWNLRGPDSAILFGAVLACLLTLSFGSLFQWGALVVGWTNGVALLAFVFIIDAVAAIIGFSQQIPFLADFTATGHWAAWLGSLDYQPQLAAVLVLHGLAFLACRLSLHRGIRRAEAAVDRKLEEMGVESRGSVSRNRQPIEQSLPA